MVKTQLFSRQASPCLQLTPHEMSKTKVLGAKHPIFDTYSNPYKMTHMPLIFTQVSICSTQFSHKVPSKPPEVVQKNTNSSWLNPQGFKCASISKC